MSGTDPVNEPVEEGAESGAQPTPTLEPEASAAADADEGTADAAEDAVDSPEGGVDEPQGGADVSDDAVDASEEADAPDDATDAGAAEAEVEAGSETAGDDAIVAAGETDAADDAGERIGADDAGESAATDAPGAKSDAGAPSLEQDDDDEPAAGAARHAPRRSHRPRAVDFSQPTKFTSEQQRRIARGLEGFCQTASTRLSSELRTPLELEVGAATQVAWLMAQRQLPANSLAVTLEVEPLGTRMLLAADLRLVLVAVECLLGGAPERAPEERRLTEIDWALIRRLFDTIVAQLSAAWQDLARVSLRAGDIELQAEAVQIASVSEPTLVFKLLSRIGEHPGNMTLMIPWQAIDPVAQALGGHGPLEEIEDGEAVVAIERALSDARVTMRAEVAAVRMGVDDLLSLREGSVVKLGGRVEAGVSLVVEDRVIARGLPGRRGQRRAVQIVATPNRGRP